MLLGFAATILLGQAVAAVCAMVAAGCANTATMRLRHTDAAGCANSATMRLRHTDAAGCAMVAAVCARFAGRGAVCAHMRAQGRTRAPGWIWTTGG